MPTRHSVGMSGNERAARKGILMRGCVLFLAGYISCLQSFNRKI